eukprot:3685462-Rhodomonas_salina.1
MEERGEESVGERGREESVRERSGKERARERSREESVRGRSTEESARILEKSARKRSEKARTGGWSCGRGLGVSAGPSKSLRQ